MLNVLVVSYTPRFASNTLRLVETALAELDTKLNVTHLDLLETPPPLLDAMNLNALLKRNYMAQALTEVEQLAVRGVDRFLNQVLNADRLLIAFPMYNFNVPAAIKAWVDTIVQKDRTFAIDDNRRYYPLCKNKQALILMTSGGDYSEAPMQAMNHASTFMEQCLSFIGISSHTIAAYGLNLYPERVDQIVAQAQQDIRHYLANADEWLKQVANG